MTRAIVLDVTHPDNVSGKIGGFSSFWAYYVKGFDSRAHCQKCLKGRLAADLNTFAVGSSTPILLDRMDQFSFLYVCGVGRGRKAQRYRTNFHLPLRYQEGSSVSAVTYNGYIVTAQHAVLLPVPALRHDALKDAEGKVLPECMTRCKNFQFAVEYFGYPSPRTCEPAQTEWSRPLPGI